MDYRSAIQLSFENKQKALKESQARKVNGSNGSTTKKSEGPSEEAIKKFLIKKQEKELERFLKLKVVKPIPAPAKSKVVKEAKSEAKTKDVVKAALPKKEKAAAPPPVIEPPKKLEKLEPPKKKKVESAAPKPSVAVPKPSVAAPKSSAAVPSFSKYADLLAMANLNASKPSADWRNPDAADRKEALKKKKKEAQEAEPYPADFHAPFPTSKKRKIPKKDDTVHQSLAPDVKKAKKSAVRSTIDDDKASKPPTSSLAPSERHRPKVPLPAPSGKKGIAAQLSTPAPSSSSSSSSSSKSKLPTSKPQAPSAPTPPPNRPPAKDVAKPKARESQVATARPPPGRGGIAAQNSARPPPTKTAPSARPPVMSVTMEDADSNFIQYSRKYDAKQLHRQAPPQPPPPPPPRRGGIASQNALLNAKITKVGSFRYGETSDVDDEDEYDEEDDFIDDSDIVSENQYKDVVAEIHRSLRFDPSKYEKVTKFDDLRSMESNFKDIEKEEKRSARLGMKEDLEDIRAEQERLKKKRK